VLTFLVYGFCGSFFCFALFACGGFLSWSDSSLVVGSCVLFVLLGGVFMSRPDLLISFNVVCRSSSDDSCDAASIGMSGRSTLLSS
jgi:hypothetical protein